MTDTPAEVAEALDALSDFASSARVTAYAQNHAAVIRAQISNLERQLAEAQNKTTVDAALIGALLAKNESLQSQLAAQRERDGRDAARWRFIRANASSGTIFCVALPGGALNCDEPEAEWDAAIDAALKDRP